MFKVPCRFCRGDVFLRVQDLNRKGKYYCSADCEHAATLKPVKVWCRGCQGRFWAVKSPVYPERCPACVALLVARPKREPVKPKPVPDSRVLVIRELLPYLRSGLCIKALACAIDTRSAAWWTEAGEREIKSVLSDIVSGF